MGSHVFKINGSYDKEDVIPYSPKLLMYSFPTWCIFVSCQVSFSSWGLLPLKEIQSAYPLMFKHGCTCDSLLSADFTFRGFLPRTTSFRRIMKRYGSGFRREITYRVICSLSTVKASRLIIFVFFYFILFYFLLVLSHGWSNC